MNVLFAASEAVPLVKSGGLADVIGSLPQALQKQGADVRIILPKYADIPQHYKDKMETVKTFNVYVGWRNQYCGLQELDIDGIHYYFIDNEFYFGRSGLYGYGDDAERFIFFCRAVSEALPHLNFKPDIIHCHDWQTALIPFMLKAHYAHIPYYDDFKTMFTIHNLMYQGRFNREWMMELLSVGDSYFTPEGLEFHGDGNCLKGALVYADLITTVSKTYAEEIQTPTFGENLDGVLRSRSSDLFGIVNGLDNEAYDPMNDSALPVKYRNAIGKKRVNKMRFQESVGLPVGSDIPMIGLVSRLVEQKGLDLIAHILDELLEMDVQLAVLGTGDWHYEQLFKDAARRHPDKVSANIMFDDGLARNIYASSDLFLMPSKFEPCGLGQLIALRYRSIPIVRETGGLKDTVQPYNEFTGEGTGFTFMNYNAHELLFTIQRAVHYYHSGPEVWTNLVYNISKVDFGWNQSAKQYMFLYDHLLAKQS
jgi:starch synthase